MLEMNSLTFTLLAHKRCLFMCILLWQRSPVKPHLIFLMYYVIYCWGDDVLFCFHSFRSTEKVLQSELARYLKSRRCCDIILTYAPEIHYLVDV